MTEEKTYIFTSSRLGFRAWNENDLTELVQLNSDERVMKHFPKPLTEIESSQFLKRLINHLANHQYTYFATEELKTGKFIGFIGLAYQDYEAPFTPNTDIGWRLIPSSWGHGLATEGAKRCLQFAFDDLGIKKIVSTCTQGNKASEAVMRKIGMKKKGEFLHPKLKAFPDLENCVWYEISKEEYLDLRDS